MTRSEQGAALVLTLLIMSVISAIGLGCVLMARAETKLGSAFDNSTQLGYAADAALAKVQAPICGTLAPLASGVSAFDDHRTLVPLADGTALDLAAETAARQRESDDFHGSIASNPDAPQWRLIAHAPLADLIPGAVANPAVYVAVWLADDAEDGDADPGADSNGQIVVLGAAFGARRGLRIAQERLACPTGLGRARVDAWRIVR